MPERRARAAGLEVVGRSVQAVAQLRRVAPLRRPPSRSEPSWPVWLVDLVLQSQFSALLLVVGASSGGLMTAAPDRPGEGERRVDRWAPDQAGQQPTQLG